MWLDLVRALALMMVLEGILPFLAPGRWRETLLRVAQLDDRMLRSIGVGSMIIGLVILQLARSA